MAVLACDDGSVLEVLPVPVVDRDGVPYEVTLRMSRDGQPFGEVGERCGFFLAATAARVQAAIESGVEFPDSSLQAGLRAWAADTGRDPGRTWAEQERYLPRDRELFCFRSRDPDDVSSTGELRVTLEVQRRWARGWQVERLAVVHAWGTAGVGVRSVLDSGQLLAFLEALVQDVGSVGARYDGHDDATRLRRPVG